jgi:hypothetical protein
MFAMAYSRKKNRSNSRPSCSVPAGSLEDFFGSFRQEQTNGTRTNEQIFDHSSDLATKSPIPLATRILLTTKIWLE